MATLNHFFVNACVVVQRGIKYVTSTVPDGGLGQEEAARSGHRLFRKEPPAPHAMTSTQWLHAVRMQLAGPPGCLHLMLPINNWPKRRRKCAAINPCEMTLIMWRRQKGEKKPEQVICGPMAFFFLRDHQRLSVLVASSAAGRRCGAKDIK